MSNINIVCDGDRMTVRLSGEVDQHTAKAMRGEIDRRIRTQTPRSLKLDLKDVSFMDSAGIGLILGRYKLMSEAGGRVELCNVPESCGRIIGMSGITHILDIKEY